MIVSSGDISFNTDPLAQPGILGGIGVVFPVSSNQATILPNAGAPFVPGVYYFTRVRDRILQAIHLTQPVLIPGSQ